MKHMKLMSYTILHVKHKILYMKITTSNSVKEPFGSIKKKHMFFLEK